MKRVRAGVIYAMRTVTQADGPGTGSEVTRKQRLNAEESAWEERQVECLESDPDCLGSNLRCAT